MRDALDSLLPSGEGSHGNGKNDAAGSASRAIRRGPYKPSEIEGTEKELQAETDSAQRISPLRD
jgi:hypothetical protein